MLGPQEGLRVRPSPQCLPYGVGRPHVRMRWKEPRAVTVLNRALPALHPAQTRAASRKPVVRLPGRRCPTRRRPCHSGITDGCLRDGRGLPVGLGVTSEHFGRSLDSKPQSGKEAQSTCLHREKRTACPAACPDAQGWAWAVPRDAGLPSSPAAPLVSLPLPRPQPGFERLCPSPFS